MCSVEPNFVWNGTTWRVGSNHVRTIDLPSPSWPRGIAGQCSSLVINSRHDVQLHVTFPTSNLAVVSLLKKNMPDLNVMYVSIVCGQSHPD